MSLLSTIYGQLARSRRRWYLRHPEVCRRLGRPVISVGNLTVGGSGKTPLVACVARCLHEAGERPAILSRGYARRRAPEGVVVVRDRAGVRAGLDEAGDEPLMLARALEGVAVLVSPDRHLAGSFAEARLDCTVHVLDDGFQHFRLARDVDLLVGDARDLLDGRPLPAGRLREPLDAAAAADAIVVTDASAEEAAALAARLQIGRAFRGVRRQQAARLIDAGGDRPVPPGVPVFAVAGIARPDRFFADLDRAGWRVAGRMTFRDHRRYTAADVRRMTRAARAAGADLLLTTGKDLVRLLPHVPLDLPLAWVPLDLTVEPSAEFTAWLESRLERARA